MVVVHNHAGIFDLLPCPGCCFQQQQETDRGENDKKQAVGRKEMRAREKEQKQETGKGILEAAGVP